MASIYQKFKKHTPLLYTDLFVLLLVSVNAVTVFVQDVQAQDLNPQPHFPGASGGQPQALNPQPDDPFTTGGVPEPSSGLATLAFSTLLGVGWVLKRKQKKVQ